MAASEHRPDGAPPVGQVIPFDPIAPVESATRRVPAGVVTLGLESRTLDSGVVSDFYTGHQHEQAALGEMAAHGPVDDGGLSIHVFGTDDQREYLRFDCFRGQPHYHYLLPDESYQVVVPLDIVANGDPFEWALNTIRARLPEMLAAAGAPELAVRIDKAAIAGALSGLTDRSGEPGREGL